MADIGAIRGGGWYVRGAGVAWGIGLALSVASCADLLDLPSDPRLEEPEQAQAGEGAAARGESARGNEGLGPAPLLAAEPSRETAGGASSGSGSSDDPGPGSANPGAGASDDGGDAPAAASGSSGSGAAERPDAGAPPAAPDGGGEPPELPDEEPEPPPGGCVQPESVGPDGRCYLVVTELLAWEDARDNCQDRGDGWDLAAIRDPALNAFVGSLSDEETWLGGSDADDEGTWRWVSDGAPFWSGDGTTGSVVGDAFEAWNSDEPNGRGNSDCARSVPIVRTGDIMTWADLECFELRASICEGPPL